MRSDRIVALIGAPNSGKTTLYNWLTNSKFKTVNYPGATVEYAVGTSAERLGPFPFTVIDTPGTYSLHPKSEDEQVTFKVLTEPLPIGSVSHILVVVDGTQLARHLLLAKQVAELGLPFAIVITMSDLLRKSGLNLSKEVIEKEFSVPVVFFDGLLGGGLEEVGRTVRNLPSASNLQIPQKWTESILAVKVARCEALAKEASGPQHEQGIQSLYQRTKNWDRLLLHPFLGLLLFFIIMTSLFVSIYWLATPAMDLVDQAFAWLADQVKSVAPDSELVQFLGEGVIPSFAAVLVFVPQIFILFFGIGILESSGYLARAATLIDRPFSKLGLTGRSFVPVLSGFACAVPAIMATRNLSSKRDRWITNFIIPLMTCSARLPVYALLLGFLFVGKSPLLAGLALALLYFGALIVGGLAAAILNRILPVQGRSYLMMELPMYRRPRWRVLLTQTLGRTKSYIRRAGPVIFTLAVVIWVGSHFPRNLQLPEADRFEHSYLAQVGHLVDPVFQPMGVDWRVGVGLISAFAAREVFVSTLALIFHVEGDEEAQSEGLLQTMQKSTFEDGSPLFTTASVVGLLIFFMIALQCMSTFAIQLKETGSLKFALGQLVLFNVVAYVLAVLVVQGLRAAGIA